ncbi:MAG TPA: BMC domain-containing protein [Actinoplanes sp.]|jgi:hypothetical protein|nr:BMC domain-containing protein [Actinoplanes sp.]
MADSVGTLQVRGLASAFRAANLAANTAAVTVAGFAYMHEGQVVVTLRGAVDSVRAAVDAVLGGLGPDVVTAHSVIGRVATDLDPVLRERTVRVGGRVGAPVVRGRGRAYAEPAPETGTPPDRNGTPAGGSETPADGSGTPAPGGAAARKAPGGRRGKAGGPPAGDDGPQTPGQP